MKELAITLDTEKKQPLYEQIYEALREAILQGRILQGEKLPSTRFEAEYLQVSRSTVELAYDQLISEGYIHSEPYRGYFACDVRELYNLTDIRTGEMKQKQFRTENQQGTAEAEGLHGETGSSLQKQTSYEIDFSLNELSMDNFPYNGLSKIMKNLLLDHGKQIMSSGSVFGEKNLKETICDYLYHARNVRCTPEQIIIGAGNEYLQLMLIQMLGTSHGVAMESPTYLRAYRTFKNAGLSVREVALDDAGMRVDLLRKTDAGIAYVMPSHQFPLGIVMPMKRRLELLNWAVEEPERYIIEDDYDSEFRYKGKPIPALQGIDRSGRVIYLGTFSKSIASSIRVSYMVLPEHLLERYQECCGFYACTVPNLMQQAICQFMQEGYFEKNLNRMRAIYKSKHDFMLAELKKYSWVREIMGENSGLHLLVEVDTDCSEQDVIEACAEQQIRVYGLSEYYISQNPKREYPILLLGYGGLTEGQIADGLQMIDEVLAELKKYQPISVHKE